MSLPVQFGRVNYRVAGLDYYQGQLIITRGIIYYLPGKNLRKLQGNPIIGGVLGGGAVGAAVRATAPPLDESVSLVSRPTLDLDEVWREQTSEQALQEILDAHIAEFKGYRSLSSDDLPKPRRYPKEEVRNLKVTLTGRLKFETEFDEHDFNVGVTRRGQLRQALAESGFTS
ncbi:MAG TPA: hypothetical protein VF546_16680 [Pyrinomonadaceae bacterium]|jgi:hypothetical protein